MKAKIISILVMTLLIATTVSPVLGLKVEKSSYNVECGVNLVYDPVSPSNVLGMYDTYNIYEGQYLKVTLTGYWNPPNPTKTICLWANAGTMPAGATLTPPCNCALGSVSSDFEWTPSVGQAGLLSFILVRLVLRL